MANKIVQLHDEANNNIYPVTTLDAIHGSGALRADFVLKQGDTLTGPLTATKFIGPLQGNADSATKLQTARTLTIGNSGKTFNGSANVSWPLHDILYVNSHIGTSSSWDITTPGVYSVGSDNGATFTGAGNPESANGGLLPYRWGQLIVSRANTSGLAQFYISHHDSGDNSYGIKFRTGYNNTYLSTWNTILDSSNYTSYTVTKTGSGASGTWGINVTGHSGTLRSVFAVDTSRYNQPITWFRANGTTEHAYIGAHNTGNSKGAIIIQPAYSSGDKWATNQGLYIGASELRFNNNFVLHSANYSSYALPKAGGTLTGSIGLKVSGIDLTHATNNCTSTQYPTTFNILDQNERIINRLETILTANSGDVATYWYVRNYDSSGNVVGQKGIRMTINKSGTLSTTISDTVTVGQLYGAVWNDYAEYRNQEEVVEPGYCVTATDNGKVYKTSKRLQPCDGVVSDTFGFAIGETDECKTPLAVAGRVLVYCYGDYNNYHFGDCVCAGPNGLAYKMTDEEIRNYPHRIVGIVSEIPEYEEWGQNPVKVNGRIWIKVK